MISQRGFCRAEYYLSSSHDNPLQRFVGAVLCVLSDVERLISFGNVMTYFLSTQIFFFCQDLFFPFLLSKQLFFLAVKTKTSFLFQPLIHFHLILACSNQVFQSAQTRLFFFSAHHPNICKLDVGWCFFRITFPSLFVFPEFQFK